MSKWIVIVLLAVAGWLFFQYGVDFVVKVNQTVNKANTSIERDANSVNNALEFNRSN